MDNRNAFYKAPDITEQTRAAEARHLYRSLLDASDDAIFSTTLEGVITTWNRSAHRIFGYAEPEAVGHPVTLIIPPELHFEERAIQRRLTTGEHVGHYETYRVSKDGKRINVSINVSPIRDAENRAIGRFDVVRDITESKRAEAALRESEERFRLVANTAPVMIWMSDVEKRCVYVNQGWLEFTGRPIESKLQNGWGELVHPDDLRVYMDTYLGAFDRRESFRLEYRLRRRDGTYRWVLDQGVPRFNADSSFAGYIGSAMDVTGRKLAEDALSSVSQRLIEAHEEERGRIARELHDDINQRIGLLAMNLNHLKRGLPISVRLRRKLDEAAKQVEELGKDIQSLSHRLHSPKLEYLGLAAAAHSFCKECSDLLKVEIDFHAKNIPKDLSPGISLCLFRVLQEALQNANKHGGSRHMEVSLTGTIDEIELIVHDSGIGFEPETALRGRGLGLSSMLERLKLVNGQLFIDSKPHHGTTIRARVPLHL